MGNATNLTTTTFQETISDGIALIDFWAEWCAPCKMMTPVIEELALDYEGKATIAKINIDEEGDLATKYGVNSIPTLLVFKDGEVAKKFVGVTKKDELEKALKEAGAA